MKDDDENKGVGLLMKGNCHGNVFIDTKVSGKNAGMAMEERNGVGPSNNKFINLSAEGNRPEPKKSWAKEIIIGVIIGLIVLAATIIAKNYGWG